MTASPDINARAHEALREVTALRREIADEGRKRYHSWRGRVARSSFAPSALNFAHYLALRRHDIRPLQRKLCGPRHLRRGSFEIASEIFPVRHLSGDFISIFDFEDDLVFAIGDIAGKGLSAAMWFSHLVTAIRLQFETCGDPASTLVAINHDLLRTNLEIPLSTLLLARLDTATGEITYCNAGHPPAFLMRGQGLAESLSEGGPILGVLSSASFTNGKTAMLPGDTLIGYSDGALECRNSVGDEFGSDGLLAAARNSCGSAASAALFSVLAAVEDFTGSQPRGDDISLIVAHRVAQ